MSKKATDPDTKDRQLPTLGMRGVFRQIPFKTDEKGAPVMGEWTNGGRPIVLQRRARGMALSIPGNAGRLRVLIYEVAGYALPQPLVTEMQMDEVADGGDDLPETAESSVLLRRAIGVIHDLDRTRRETEEILDAYAKLWGVRH